MVVCPVAIAVGCNKCPIVAYCPLKRTLGNFVPAPALVPPAPAAGRDRATAARPRAATRAQRRKKK